MISPRLKNARATPEEVAPRPAVETDRRDVSGSKAIEEAVVNS